ncbi:MAG TPA: phosphoglycerate mutase family protein [Actinomycetes bacterium]|nr:phosphoglycerate mutase family protein [Actinomycetes bacterium]
MPDLLLVRHAKAADRETWTEADRDRPLVERGRRQAERLAAALAGSTLALVAASPWLRCVQTAEPLAAAAGLQVQPDRRLGYDAPDLAGWVAEAVRAAPGGDLVAVGHADLIPRFLLDAGLLPAWPAFRTGSLFRVPILDGGLGPARYVDRAELRRQAG